MLADNSINTNSGGIVDTTKSWRRSTYPGRWCTRSAQRACSRPRRTRAAGHRHRDRRSTVVLRQHDVDTLAHDPRLEGIGLMFASHMMGIKDGPLRDWYSRLMSGPG